MKKIILITHYSPTPSLMEKFQVYFRSKAKVFTISHPLNLNSGLSSIVKDENKEFKFKIFPKLQYFFEGIFSLWYYSKLIYGKKPVIDLAICYDPLCFTHIYLLKWLFKIKSIVYYNLDFSPQRFKNNMMNFIYQRVNLFSYRRCDYFFCPTKKFVEELDPNNKFSHKAFTIPHIIRNRNAKENFKRIPNSIIFAGSISYAIDFKPLLEALKKLKDKKIKFKFDIYGDGDGLEDLVKQVKELNLDEHVNFKGVVDNQTLNNDILPKFTIGVAPYILEKRDFAPDHMFKGTDLTTKLVEYIAAGLTIITTRLFDAFDMIEENKFGFLVRDQDDWFQAITSLFKNQELLNNYSRNAVNFSANYDEEKVLTPVFNKILF